jgi:protein-S-isoprenylcysteine O-methyltransferase Ste14
MKIQIAFLAWGWVLFWLYWFIAALGTKRSVSFNVRKIRLFFATRLVIVVVIVAVVHFLPNHRLVNYYLASGNNLIVNVGVAIFAIGLLLAVWARLCLGKNWGTPMSEKQDPTLVTSGPYRVIRHPIYSGVLLAMLGSVLADGVYWLIILVAAGLYFGYSAYQEEKFMLRQFPQDYPGYQRRTKMLIPYLW